jgi:hypothetical protein
MSSLGQEYRATITKLEAQVESLTADLNESERQTRAQMTRLYKTQHSVEQYNRLANYVIPKKHLWQGHDGSHVDSVIREIELLEAQNERLMSRGIEDMRFEIERLEAIETTLQAYVDKRHAVDNGWDEWTDVLEALAKT